jgi:hypothetical protein
MGNASSRRSRREQSESALVRQLRAELAVERRLHALETAVRVLQSPPAAGDVQRIFEQVRALAADGGKGGGKFLGAEPKAPPTSLRFRAQLDLKHGLAGVGGVDESTRGGPSDPLGVNVTRSARDRKTLAPEPLGVDAGGWGAEVLHHPSDWPIVKLTSTPFVQEETPLDPVETPLDPVETPLAPVDACAPQPEGSSKIAEIVKYFEERSAADISPPEEATAPEIGDGACAEISG